MPVSTAMYCKKRSFLGCRSRFRRKSGLWFFPFVYPVALEGCRNCV
jgi:hypothetical protein